ncbi:polysaccharide deacetylase family protein [Bradyrhizobium tropiciagri]|uniref:polysaccharide deacetylase family protein n=1 Tax=Bradyrhizobium tropiciagri TaxID=312253 RepID=UPI001BABE067|nr:polysaccharide deacetylase family protein [Bradyrhizobium tropiciagri]MBR0874710.1 polysaccharide deacetylase family protein [Bradyrhizobium tropiciagri]
MRNMSSKARSILNATVVLLALTPAVPVGSARAAECTRDDALGTARVMEVDPATYPRVGLKSFPQTLPLHDREVVLTFDDGPTPGVTDKVLTALGAECVRATFFMVGRNAADHPDMVRKIARLGHTIGYHTWDHPHLNKMPTAQAEANINRGIEAVGMALRGIDSTVPATPFFRFPYFESTPELLDHLEKRGIAVFGADFWASDWVKMTPEEELRLLTGRLEAARKGIILLHDPQMRTAQMLPAFLRYLHEHNYRIVHIVPAGVKTVSDRSR